MGRDGDVEKAILAEMRKPQSNLVDRVTAHNQIILHNFQKSVERSAACQLLGCGQKFALNIIPNQVLYPKFCEEHRSEFRRQNFLRQIAEQPDAYRYGTNRAVESAMEMPRVQTPEAE